MAKSLKHKILTELKKECTIRSMRKQKGIEISVCMLGMRTVTGLNTSCIWYRTGITDVNCKLPSSSDHFRIDCLRETKMVNEI